MRERGAVIAVALDYADLTLGAETSGSVLAPAEAAGVVGLKAAHSGCSITGIVPIDDRLDSVGVFARSLRDARLAHDATCGIGEIAPTLRERAAGWDIDEAPAAIADLRAGFAPSLQAHLAESPGPPAPPGTSSAASGSTRRPPPTATASSCGPST